MSSSYDGPSKHEILALVRGFNRYHPKQQIQVVGLSELDVVLTCSLETAERERKANYNTIQRSAESLMKDLKEVMRMQHRDDLTGLSSYTIVKRAKEFINLLQEPERWFHLGTKDDLGQRMRVNFDRLEREDKEKKRAEQAKEADRKRMAWPGISRMEGGQLCKV